MYTNGEPTGIVKEYLDWILSDEAQLIVAELGFVPVLKWKPLARLYPKDTRRKVRVEQAKR